MTAIDERRVKAQHGAAPGRAAVPGVLAVGAIASLGAGAIHATAAGAHSEHRAAVVAFVLTAIAQLGWGAWALGRPGRLVGLVGAAVNAAAFGGWVQAKTGGISFVAGLDTKESVQFADALAATLALIAVAGALTSLAGQRRAEAVGMRRADGSDQGRVDASGQRRAEAAGQRRGQAEGPSRALIWVVAIVTVAFVVPGMVTTPSHLHAGGQDHASGDDHAGGQAHEAAPELPVPYMATLPVNLGGVPGVSDEEVAAAEALVTDTLQTLPRFADIATIVAAGYNTIGDADTGFEHFVNWALIDDGRVLDPAYPESLVFTVDPVTGEQTLSAAMFVANPGDTLDTVPAVGGPLVQWHIHDNLCWAGPQNAWRVADVVEPGQDCRPGTFRLGDIAVPMVHVWIIPHECGPFAALEGDGAGQIRPGEERLCDHAHGAPD